MNKSKATPKGLLWRPALAAAISLVALLAMGSGLFQGSDKAFADTPIIFTGDPDAGGAGGTDGDDGQIAGLDSHCDKHLEHAARHAEHAAKAAAKGGKHAAEHAAKHTRHADKEMAKYRECLAKLLIASVLSAPDPQAEADAVGLDLEAIGIDGDSLDTVAWDAIKWNAIKWSAIQWDAIKWNAIKWNNLDDNPVGTQITFQ